MSGQLLRYDAACRAVAEAVRIDEAQDIASKADAVRHYARMANNRELETQAAEIRIRAEWRIGQLLIEEKAAGHISVGQPPKLPEKNGAAGEPFFDTSPPPPGPIVRRALAALGVSKKLSSRAQQLARLEPVEFEGMVARWREKSSAETERVTTSLLKADARAKQRSDFAARVETGCTVNDLDGLAAAGRRFGVILADPPWAFQTWSELGQDRDASRHYAVDPLAAIAALPLAALAAPDCALLLWVTWPFLEAGLDLIKGWGFTYKTCGFDWMKLNPSGQGLFMGMGRTGSRQNTEPCLLATRGAPHRLNADVLQAILAPVGAHSVKPERVHGDIERLFGGPYLEVYGRQARAGWTVHGNEIARADFDAAAEAGFSAEIVLPRFLRRDLAGGSAA